MATGKQWRIDSTIPLSNGVQMPLLGLGVWRSHAGRETHQAVRDALDVGYRHVDTARAYRNEGDVGAAVRDSGIPRKEVFVTTKLWNDDQGYDSALRAFDASLQRLGMEYVDLYLIHWPLEGVRLESWRALQTIDKEKRARAVGVSNFTVRHLQELLDKGMPAPAVNQVEFHPFLYQAELLEFCRKHGIVLEAYSPLVQAQRMDHPTLVSIARNHKKTPAQVLVRWCIEHEVVVIPKSVHRARIEENANVFDFALEPDEVRALDALNQDLHISWDPTDVP